MTSLNLFFPGNPNSEIKGFIFDKDGTLLDLNSTWGKAMSQATIEVCESQEQVSRLAQTLGLDIEKQCFMAESKVPETDGKTTALLISTVTDPLEFSRLTRKYANDTVKTSPGADELLQVLNKNGYRVAMATNDSESSAKKFVELLNWNSYFELIYGFDSGYGSKPDPGMLKSCCEHFQLNNDEIIMVGDTKADLLAADDANIAYIQLGELRNPEELEVSVKIESLAQLIPLLTLG